MYDPAAYVWAITIAGPTAIAATTCTALYRGAERAGLRTTGAVLLAGAAAALLGGWFTATAVIADNGWYRTLPWFPVAAAGLLGVLLALSRVPVVARSLSAPGMASRLVRPHSFRVAGVVFLLYLASGHLPALFALPAGLGDIAAGVAAPLVARRLAQGTGRRAAFWFNVFGLTDLVTGLILGALTGFQLLNVTPSSAPIVDLPLVLIPTATVPLMFALHITSLSTLAAGLSDGNTTSGGIAAGSSQAPAASMPALFPGPSAQHDGRGDLLQARQPRQITPESPVAQGRHGDHGDDRALPDWRNVKLRSAVIISALCAAAGLAAGSAPAFAATPRPAGSPVSASTVSTVRQPGFVSVSAPGHTEGWASVTYLRAHPDAIPGLRVTVAPSTVIPDSASGCNYDVCIDITGSSTNVSNWTTTAYGNVGCTMPWFIWTEPGQGTEHEAGPNICPTSGGDGVYYDTQGPFGYFPGGSHLCNTWNRIPGEPCENIKA